MAIGEHNIAEEARLFVVRGRLHDGITRAGQNFPRLLQIQQQCAKAITVSSVGAVIHLQPAVRRANGGSPGANTRAVPHARTGVRQTTVVAPMKKIGRLRQPEVIAAKGRTAGTMERVIVAADPRVEDGAIFVVRRENHSMGSNTTPIGRAAQSHTDAVGRDFGESQVIDGSYLSNATILDAVSFQFATAE